MSAPTTRRQTGARAHPKGTADPAVTNAIIAEELEKQRQRAELEHLTNQHQPDQSTASAHELWEPVEVIRGVTGKVSAAIFRHKYSRRFSLAEPGEDFIQVSCDGAGNYLADDGTGRYWRPDGTTGFIGDADPVATADEFPPPEGVAVEPQDRSDAATIARLAALPLLDYDREREAAASALGVRVATLDKEVAKARQCEDSPDDAAGRMVRFYEPEPWPDPVTGHEVLDEALAVLLRHMVMRPEDAAAVVLWCAHVYLFAGFSHSPRLLITAPDAECGKTMLLFHMVGNLVTRAQSVELMKAAPFFRLAELHKPTFLIDEMDVFIEGDSELLAAVNNGWEPHGCVLRCIGDDNDVRQFGTHTPVAMAGIDLLKKLPGTTVSRSVVVTLERAADDELAEQNIYDARIHRAPIREIGRRLARWTGDHGAPIFAADPVMPLGVRNRLADKWRPLLAIADAAGGSWPALARAALAAQTDEREPSKALQLLSDVRDVLCPGEISIATADLIARLCTVEDAPWKDYNYQERDDDRRRITSRQVSTLLKRYKVHPGNVKIDGRSPKGYRTEAVTAACNRYLPRDPPDKSATPLPCFINKGLGAIYPLPQVSVGSGFNGPKSLNNNKGSGVADNLGGFQVREGYPVNAAAENF